MFAAHYAVTEPLAVNGPDGPWWVAVFTRTGSANENGGVFTSASRDLRHWLPPERLWRNAALRSNGWSGLCLRPDLSFPIRRMPRCSDIFGRSRSLADDPASRREYDG